MKKDDVMRLQHMLEAAREATFFAKGHKREDLDTNRMLMHTLVRVIEIIGEAATNVSTEARERIPNIEVAQSNRYEKPACSCLFRHQPRYPLGYGGL